MPCFFLFFCAYGLLTASVKLALVLCYQAQRLHMHCLFPPLPHPLLNLAFCDCACVLSESIFVHVYGDGPLNGCHIMNLLAQFEASMRPWPVTCIHGICSAHACMDFFFTGGRCNYHSKLKKKTLHGLKALNYLGFGIARNLIVLSRIFQLKKNSI